MLQDDFASWLRGVRWSTGHITWDLVTPENIGQAIGAVASFLAVSISLIHISRHWKHNRTKLCKPTVRLLFIVPLFALDAWACLMLEASVFQWAEVLTGFREVYESVAVVSFMELVLTILGGTEELCQAMLEGVADPEDPPVVRHIWPLRLVLRPYRQGAEFLKAVLWGIFQYVFVSLSCLFFIFLFWLLLRIGLMGHGVSHALRAVANAVRAGSCAWALNCLLLFAHQVYKRVPPCGLFLKFLSIKGIVFFTFWQGFVIWLFYKRGCFGKFERFIADRTNLNPEWWDDSDLRSGLNDLLLCIEALGFSILHLFAYPAKEGQWLSPSVKERIACCEHRDPPERVLSTLNLLNMIRLKTDTDRLADGSPAARAIRKANHVQELPLSLLWIDAICGTSQPAENARPLLRET